MQSTHSISQYNSYWQNMYTSVKDAHVKYIRWYTAFFPCIHRIFAQRSTAKWRRNVLSAEPKSFGLIYICLELFVLECLKPGGLYMRPLQLMFCRAFINLQCWVFIVSIYFVYYRLGKSCCIEEKFNHTHHRAVDKKRTQASLTT